MKMLNQIQIANQMGISKSYLSMILSGGRKATPELVEKLQSIPDVHKVVNIPLCEVPCKQRVERSNRSMDAMKLSNPLPQAGRQS